MDFDSTLAKIKQRGYWRVEFFPTIFVESALGSLQDCRALMTEARVELRGWDFPHFPRKNDAKQEIYPIDNNRIESWIDWSIHKELWRLYRSGKFTYLGALHEQWYDEYEIGWAGNPLDGVDTRTMVDVTSTIYKLTEVFVFFANMAEHMPAIDSFEVRVTMQGVKKHKLVILEPRRMGLYGDYVNRSTETTAANMTLTRGDLVDRDSLMKTARESCQRIFENFGWQASEALLESDQTQLLTRRF